MPTRSAPRKHFSAAFVVWNIRLMERHSVVQPVTVRTPLSQPITKHTGSKYFTLEPGTVAEAVVNQVLRRESAQLILPARYGFVSSMRAWPSWLQEGARSEGANAIQGPN